MNKPEASQSTGRWDASYYMLLDLTLTDILLHKAAKKAFDALGAKKLPTVRQLQEEYQDVLDEKKGMIRAYLRTPPKMSGKTGEVEHRFR